MIEQANSSILTTLGNTKAVASGLPVRAFPKKRQRILSLPGLTGPVLLVGSVRVKTEPKSSLWRDILSLVADILDLRSWRNDPLGGFMLAAYVAAVAQPLVYGNLGTSIVALMTPVK